MDYYTRPIGRRRTTNRTGRALLVRLSDDERETLDNAARADGATSTASWIRALGLNAARIKKGEPKKSGAKKGAKQRRARDVQRKALLASGREP